MRVNWGICGCGAISNDFVNALRLLPLENHMVVAAAANSREKANNFLQSHDLNGKAKSFGNYTDLFNDKTVDIVYIGVINSLHKDQVIAALKAGKHVLCEKPLGLNSKEVKEMIAVAEQQGKFLMEGFWTNCFPAYQQLKKEIKGESIGDPKIFSATVGLGYITQETSKMQPELGGGILLAIGCYLPMLSLFIFGEKPSSITARGFKTESGVDDSVTITLLFSRNRMATLVYSGSMDLDNQALLYGSNGKKLKIPSNCWCPTVLEAPDKTHFYPLPPNPQGLKFNFINSAGFVYEAECVRDCLETGKLECSNMTWKESLELAEVLDECRKQLGVSFPQD